MNIPVVEKILSANDRIAAENHTLLAENAVFGINIMASPGAGKTSVIERTIVGLKANYQIGVIEGDIATTIDSERVQASGGLAIQINTGGNCHLEAHQVNVALKALPLADLDALIIENVGNLVCPAHWTLGTHRNVLIASIPEGDDKPYKYPGMYSGVEVLIINKIDLLPYVPFRMDYFRQGVEILNPGLTTFALSCRTGEGIEAWLSWLKQQIRALTPA